MYAEKGSSDLELISDVLFLCCDIGYIARVVIFAAL